MNKYIGIAIAIIVIAGGGYYLTTRKNNDNNQTKGDSASMETQADAELSSTSLKTLLSSGKSQKCTFSSTENNATSQGTFYIADGKSRGDFVTTVEGKTTTTHVIYEDNTSYLWTEGSNSGYKIAVNSEQLSEASKNQSTSNADLDKNYNFSCTKWSKDSSVYNRPTNVEFKEFIVPTLPTGASSSGSMSAGMNAETVCAALSGEPKQQCIAAMQKR